MQRNHRTTAAAIKWLIIISTIIGFSAEASAQDIAEGKTQYQSSCASCHGIDGKGNGHISKELKTPPADLTVLAKNNNGVFPSDMVYPLNLAQAPPCHSMGVREAAMIFDRTAGGHRFAFKREVCVLCGILRAEFEKGGQPRCERQVPDMREHFALAPDNDPTAGA